MIKIYQIYFKPEQRAFLDPAFIPYSNEGDPNSKWAEYSVFRREFLTKNLFTEKYTGFVAWRFNQKTKVSGADFIRFIEENPGYDVYFINPYLIESLVFRNVWTHGESWHPGLIALSSPILKRAGHPINLKRMVFAPNRVGYCNYFVANSRFWELYMNFCESVFHVIENYLTPFEQAQIQKTNYLRPSSFHPFIMERMFSTILYKKSGIRAKRFYPEGYSETVYGQLVPVVKSAERISAYFRQAPGAKRERILEDFASLCMQILYGKLYRTEEATKSGLRQRITKTLGRLTGR